jgi:hypothetical protein
MQPRSEHHLATNGEARFERVLVTGGLLQAIAG